MREIWKEIPGYSGYYEISNIGRVKSLKRKGKRKESIMRVAISKGKNRKEGYYSICLTKNSKKKTYFIHRLVANIFIRKSENSYQINHIDGNKLNNRVNNLEWCSSKENIIHATKNGLRHSKLSKIDVANIKKEYIPGKNTQKELAERYNVNQSVISRIVRGKSWKTV